MSQENERDASRWKNEWIAVPESFVYLSGLLNHMTVLMKGLTVDKVRMLQNADMLRGMLLSEHVMFLLEKHFPLPTAHQKVYLASVRAFEKGSHLVDELVSDPEVAAKFQRADIETALDPAAYLGQAVEVARAVKLRVDQQLAAFGAKQGRNRK
jgi:adenylosuccinate lyase